MTVEWHECHSPLTDVDIGQIEAALGFSFPADFRRDVARCHGGFPVPSDFIFDDPDYGRSESTVGELLSLDPSYPDNILVVVRDLREQLPPSLIPIADDGAGNFVCFDVGSNPPPIVIWLHEKRRWRSVVELAPTWTEFLEKLHESTDGADLD